MSKLEVDKITPQSGTTLTVGEAGDTTVINGLGTLPSTIGTNGQVLSVNSGATGLQYGAAVTNLDNLNATNLTSGTVPDARFPSTLPTANGQNLTAINPTAISSGTLPALNAANLTNLNATALTSGTVPDARFPATLPAISGANLTNLPAGGITMADQWRLSAAATGLSGASNKISSNWERTDTTGYGTIGSAMTQSSGVFSFPVTGIYLIMYKINGKSTSTGNNRYANGNLYTSTNGGSSVAIAARGASSSAGNLWDFETTAIFIFDVSSTSTHKVQMGYEFEQSTQIYGGTNDSQTCVTFIRLGDT